MKKSIIAILVIACFCFSSFAFAAVDQFSDVPSNHWAYAAINQLAKAGVVNGMGDGTFQGNKTMTRYEMATIVANALTKEDKVDKETRALIDKLALEFANELKSLGQRVGALEKNASPLKIDGFFQVYEDFVQGPIKHVDGQNGSWGALDSRSLQCTDLWLNLHDQFDENTYFQGHLYAAMFPNVQTAEANQSSAFMAVQEAFVDWKFAKNLDVAAGMFMPNLGYGTTFSTPYAEGVKLGYNEDKLHINVYDTNFYVALPFISATSDSEGMNLIIGDVKYNVTKDADVTFAFSSDRTPAGGFANGAFIPGDPISGNSDYRDMAIGFEYRAIPQFTFTTEYAVNSSDNAKNNSVKYLGSTLGAKAYFANLKYQGANPFQPGSTGIWVEYKHADPGFDPLAMAGPQYWNTPMNYSWGAGGGQADNIQGLEFGVETTVAPHLIFTATYDDAKAVSQAAFADNGGGAKYNDRSFATAKFFYLF